MKKLDQAAALAEKTPQLVADVKFYSTEEGGKTQEAWPGWGCPCFATKDMEAGWDAWPLLGDQIIKPGNEYRLGFVFLSEEGAETMLSAGKFYLWEGRFIGVAIVVKQG